MHKLKAFIYCIMLATTPALLACPQDNFPHAFDQKVNRGYLQETRIWVRPTTYNEIMQMLEDLESGELERRYSPMQLERVNDFIATLAKEGILPDEFEEQYELKEDTYDLMYGEDSAFQLAHCLENGHEYAVIPAVLNGYSGYDIIQCGKISKAWKKTKKFCKKHKKAIIIGAVVIVTVTVVAVAVVAASSASAASAAGAAGAAAGAGARSSDSGHSKPKKSESKRDAPPLSAAPNKTTPPVDTNKSPVMKAVLDEHAASFKEFLVEDNAVQQITGSQEWDEMSFSEKAREVGANIAHKTLDEVTDLVKVIPQLCEEIKELGDRFLPESLKLPNSGQPVSPIENHENLVAKGHKAIDYAFSTDQAELFTAEARANNPMSRFSIGMMPLPGSFKQTFSNVRQFKEAGKVLDRTGFTKSGRGLMKHGNRKGSVFPKPLGNPAEMNRRGQMILEEILDDSKNQVYQLKNGDLKVYSSNGRGVHFQKDGTFKGFIEWQYE